MDVIFKSQDAVVTGGLVSMPDGVSLYTLIARPKSGETFPIVLYRTPYDAADSVEKVARELAFSDWLRAGFAVVRQHCRGRGLSEGECRPYHEREDGLATHDFIRTLPFYGGEIFLAGGSYLATVHLACATGFGDDIRGAVVCVKLIKEPLRDGCAGDNTDGDERKIAHDLITVARREEAARAEHIADIGKTCVESQACGA